MSSVVYATYHLYYNGLLVDVHTGGKPAPAK